MATQTEANASAAMPVVYNTQLCPENEIRTTARVPSEDRFFRGRGVRSHNAGRKESGRSNVPSDKRAGAELCQ